MKNHQLLSLLIFGSFSIFVSIAQQSSLWGTTSEGGSSDIGTIFKTDTNGNNFTPVYSFAKVNGKQPHYSKLCEASNGKYYGLTYLGGSLNDGVIFEYDYQFNSYKTLYEFVGGGLGKNPLGNLMEASNGKLYGMTSAGGTSGVGILFEFDLSTNSMTKKVDFNISNGSTPYGTLLEASNGKIYGMTSVGGSAGRGVLFEYDFTNNIYTKKVDFNITNGDRPFGSLIQATNGKLYGVTRDGGALYVGTLFEYTISTNSLVKLVEFVGSSNGAGPYEGPIQATNGKLYGLTMLGGTSNRGVLYEFDILTSTLTKKFDFIGTSNGRGPRGGLVETTNGILYGMTHQGGISGNGLIFQYDYNSNVYTKKMDFNGSQNGADPLGTLIKISNSKLLGMAHRGGSDANGVLFEYDFTLNTYDKLIDFGEKLNTLNPSGSLTYADNGMLYGLTFNGGKNNTGVLYEVDPKIDNVSIKFESLSAVSGFYPVGDLISSNGSLYGLSLKGGNTDLMSLFKYDYWLDTMQMMHSFGTVSSLAFRKYSLFLHSNGKIYGIGKRVNSQIQVLFEFDPTTNVYAELKIFQTTRSSCFLTEGQGGIIYGVNSESESINKGYLFKLDPVTNTFSTLHNFSGLDGHTPVGELVALSNGNLYGVTTFGGANNKGVLYRYNSNLNAFNKVLDLKDSSGTFPEDGLANIKSGKLYGTTKLGGAFGKGVLFEFDYNTTTFLVKHNFDGAGTGSFPQGNITKASACITTRNSIVATSCFNYTSPSGKYIYTTSGIYSDTLKVGGCDSIVTINLTIDNLNNTVTPLGSSALAANAFNSTYQWLDCNNNYAIIPNETGQLFTASSTGNYAVEVTSTINGCKDTSSCYPITLVGLNHNFFTENISIFPNPTNTNVTILFGVIQSQFIAEVYNVHGKLISESTHQSANQVELELGESKGVYFIHLISDKGERVVKKVVKN